MAGERRPYFPDTKRRKADLEAQIAAAEGVEAPVVKPKAEAKPAMSQADFSGYGKTDKRKGPPAEMLKKHFGQKFSHGGKVRGAGAAVKGFGKALKRGG